MVKISYVTITARSDYPTVGRPDLHLFEPTLQTLQKQTFTDFEYIVVDVCYEERKDYFKDHNYGLKIKHIPAAPNIWHELGLVQTCHQFNKGIIYADGELLFFDADSALLPPDLMQNLWNHYEQGWFVSLGFGADLTYASEIYERKLQADGKYAFVGGTWQGKTPDQAGPNIVPTEWYQFLGYKGLVLMDHRYCQLFENNSREMAPIPPDWYYGISTASLEATLKVNGFSNSFDGDSALNDIDFGNRLVLAGYRKLAMFRDSYVIEAYAGTQWHTKMRTIRPEVKCNYALMLYNKLAGKFRANEPLSTSDIDYIITNICGRLCNIRDKCKTLPHRGPFFNKNETIFYNHWKKYGAPEQIDLETERELRGEEGTFINVAF